MNRYSILLSLSCVTFICCSQKAEITTHANELEALKKEIHETLATLQKGVGSDAGYRAAQEVGRALNNIAQALEKITQTNITIANILTKTGNELNVTSKEISKDVAIASTNFGYNFGMGACSYMSDCIKKTVTTTKKQITTLKSFLVKTAKKPASIIAIAGLIVYKLRSVIFQ